MHNKEIREMVHKANELRTALKKKKINIEDLSNYIDTLFIPMMNTLKSDIVCGLEDFIDFIYLCLDYYTYTDLVLIDDFDYEMVMNVFIARGGKRIIYADPLDLDSRWPLIPHEVPGVVGSVEKIYSFEELEDYHHKYRSSLRWIIGPKYDGISGSVKVQNGRIVRGVTRYDGISGQDITEVVRNAKNATQFTDLFWNRGMEDGFYKVELCVGNSDFDALIEEKQYANRRSAASGIVNSPKNLHLAKYVTIIPLAYFNPEVEFVYSPCGSEVIDNVAGPKILYEAIEKMLEYCRMADFEFRTDGVVIMPIDKHLRINESDLMDNAIAYKVNTKVGLTKIKEIYISVGRMGKAVPMASVIPVEVNEIRASEASLGSMDKFVGMNLHEDETVEAFLAGDVIPQVRLPEVKSYPKHSPYIYIKPICPYCKEKLERVGRELYCKNPDCIRVVTGRIANFVSKIGMMNISDATIEDLYEAQLIKRIPDIFELKETDISVLNGYGDISAQNIVSEISKFKSMPIPLDVFFGALGIPDIGEKTVRKIFSVIGIEDIAKKRDKLFMKLIVADGIGEKTANTFIDFVKENEYLIESLMKIMNIKGLQKWKGNVVFTGFRDAAKAKQFNDIGYEISNNVNSKTVAVVTNSRTFSSDKCKEANRRGIQILFITHIDELLDELKRK